MSLLDEARTRQRDVTDALRDLARDVERSLHLGVAVSDDDLGAWAERIEQEIGETTTAVLLAARSLRGVIG